jgi:hypothetical protein
MIPLLVSALRTCRGILTLVAWTKYSVNMVKVESVEIKIEQFDESSSGYFIMANETDMNNVIAAFDGQVRHKLQLHHW